MEFWEGSLEVKPGSTVRCQPGDDHVLHLSQAALGESKKGSDSAMMYVKVDDQKLAIGTLSTDKYPQIQFDLVFDKEFEVSHTSKELVIFASLTFLLPWSTMDFDSEEDEDEEEELNIAAAKENGKAEGKKEQKVQVKAGAAVSKSDVAAMNMDKNKKDVDESEEDETDDSADDDDDEGFSSEEGDEDGSSEEDDSSEDDEDESDDDEEETPKKPEMGKKRVAENALKTPASDKKAKVATPSDQKTGGKKGGHVATPHPAKQAAKTPANNDKSKSPKSVGSVACKSCTKTFNSQMALEAHSKVKHPGAK
ncbi:hypothetical protein ACP4OV_025244 [Aristida adscensionis]